MRKSEQLQALVCAIESCERRSGLVVQSVHGFCVRQVNHVSRRLHRLHLSILSSDSCSSHLILHPTRHSHLSRSALLTLRPMPGPGLHSGPGSPHLPQPKAWAEDIVISGISGRYPECESLQEFWDKLSSGIELISSDERRWPIGESLFSSLTTFCFLSIFVHSTCD